MKKIVLSLAVLLFVSNCVILDSLGLNLAKGAVKGSEAKNLILTNALIGAAVSGNSTTFATAVTTYNTKGIKNDKFYDKPDVESCAESVLYVNAASSFTNGIALGTLACNEVREHKMIIDWPIPIF